MALVYWSVFSPFIPLSAISRCVCSSSSTLKSCLRCVLWHSLRLLAMSAVLGKSLFTFLNRVICLLISIQHEILVYFCYTVVFVSDLLLQTILCFSFHLPKVWPASHHMESPLCIASYYYYFGVVVSLRNCTRG
ncbi:hypothetical protein DFH27DRAFT_7647 [Peziza echinospora]|nr:hypothetical protein DFH27DRAFT_7647 [Peziza echinospora]